MRLHTWHVLLPGTIASLLLAGGVLAPRPALAQTASVTIQNYAFGPATLMVPVGATVTWTNRDSITHTSTSDTGAWDSGMIPPGASFSHTFTTAGTFPYHCMIHPFMHGTIVVGSASASPGMTVGRALSVTPSSVRVGTTAVVSGTGFTPTNWVFVFWQRPDRTTHGVWVFTAASGIFAFGLGFNPIHGVGTEFIAAFDWAARVWTPFTAVTVFPGQPVPATLVASPNPVANGGMTLIVGQGFAPNTVVQVTWHRPDGTVGAIRVLANPGGTFAFVFLADPRHGCGPRTFLATDQTVSSMAASLTLGVRC